MKIPSPRVQSPPARPYLLPERPSARRRRGGLRGELLNCLGALSFVIRAAKEGASRLGTFDGLAMPMTEQTVDDLKDGTTDLIGWMLSALDLIRKAVEENILDEPPVLSAADVWSLLPRVKSSMRGSMPDLTRGREVPKRSAVRRHDLGVGPVRLRAKAAGPNHDPHLGPHHQ